MLSNQFRIHTALHPILCAILLAVCLTAQSYAVAPTPPPPPQVVVTPGSATGGDLGNNTTVTNNSQCSAVVNNPPVTNDEVSVDGPHWKWSGSGSYLDSGTQTPDPGASGSETVTMSPHSPDSDSTCDYSAVFTSPGDYVTTLTATATYYETVLQGPDKGKVTSVSFTGSGNPGFPDPDASGQVAMASASTTSSAPQQNTAPKIANVTAPWQYDPDSGTNPLAWMYESPDPSFGAIQACSGEPILVDMMATDRFDRKRLKGSTGAWTAIAGVGPYQIVLNTSADASFDSATGSTSKIVPGLKTGNILLYIHKNWPGQPITVTATLQDLAPNPVIAPDIGTTKDPNLVQTWTITKRGIAPTGMHQILPKPPYNDWYVTFVSELNMVTPAYYTYQMDPVPPHYKGQSVLESFGASGAVFTMADLTPAFKSGHPSLVTPSQVSAFLFNSGDNSSFVIDADDTITDTHPGFGNNNGDISMFTAAAQTSGIGYTLSQTYSACGTTIGSYVIERQYKNGITSVRKTGP